MSSSPSTTTAAAAAFISADYNPNPSLFRRTGTAPARPSSIAAIPTVKISETSTPCAICKDDFPLHSPALRLPCSHLFHSRCIVPWLSLRNSCPVCRAKLPLPEGYSEDHDDDDSSEVEEDEVVGPGGAILEVSPTQLAQVGVVEAAVSGETVSSEWRRGARGYDDDGDSSSCQLVGRPL